MKYCNFFLRIFSVVYLALVLLWAQASVAGSDPGQQTWRLLGEDHIYTGTVADDSTTHLKDCFMSKTTIATNVWKNMVPAKTFWWYADNPAQTDLTFPAGGDWSVRIEHEQVNEWNWTADICKVADNGAVTIFATGASTAHNEVSGVTLITCHQAASQTFTAANGDRLALRINHDSDQDVRTYFYQDTHLSSLTSPVTDPAYPVPEAETILLTAFGLLIFGFYAGFQMKRARVIGSIWASNKYDLPL